MFMHDCLFYYHKTSIPNPNQNHLPYRESVQLASEDDVPTGVIKNDPCISHPTKIPF